MAKPHDDDHESQKRILELEREITKLHAMIGEVAQASAIENVLTNGFDALAAQLQPLRDLRPVRKEIPEQDAAALRKTLTALRRPSWRGSRFELEPQNDRTGDRRLGRGLAS